jgi:predicted nuclease with TOPRIM domain
VGTSKKKQIASESDARAQMDKYKGKVAEAEAAKKAMKKRIKEWEKSFKEEQGRDPTVEEKQGQAAMYGEYQKKQQELEKINNKVNAFKAMVRSAGWSVE